MTATHDPSQPVSWWTGLLDDTAACRPGADLPRRGAPPGAHVGALVVPDTLLPDALLPDALLPDALLPGALGAPAPGRLVVRLTGGAAQLGGPAALCTRAGVVPARLDTTVRDAGDPAGAARRVAAAVDAARESGVLDPAVVVAVGLPAPDAPPGTPLPYGWLTAADELAAAELALGLPTTDAPAAAAASWLDAALDRELPVVAPGPHTAPQAAALLAALRLALDGGAADEVVGVLAGDPARVAAALAALGDDTLLRTRRWLLGVGCDDVAAAGPELAQLAGGPAA